MGTTYINVHKYNGHLCRKRHVYDPHRYLHEYLHNCRHTSSYVRKTTDLLEGKGWAIEECHLTTHNGTHLDAPYHYHPTMNNGQRAITIDEVPLSWCFNPGKRKDGVIAVAAVEIIVVVIVLVLLVVVVSGC